LKLRPDFIHTIENTYGEDGKQLITNLPVLVKEASQKWEWGLALAILSAWWSIEDNTGWEYALNFAELIADLPLAS